MPADASNTDTTTDGTNGEGRTSSTACWPSPRPCRGSGARCDEDLARRGLPREKVLAAVVRLLELTLIRVGNDEYARLNRSFGLTTLRDRHASVDGTAIQFRFRGKSGKTPRGRTSRPPARVGHPPLPGPARSGAVPVRRRGRRGPGCRVRRRQRVPPGDLGRRTSPRRTSGRGPARSSPTGRSVPCSPADGDGAPQRHRGDARDGRRARQHAGGGSEQLCPPGGHGGLPRRAIGGALVEAAEEQSVPPAEATPRGGS